MLVEKLITSCHAGSNSVISYGSAGSGVLLGWSAVNRYELLFKKCKNANKRLEEIKTVQKSV
jgi:hypothetical protein